MLIAPQRQPQFRAFIRYAFRLGVIVCVATPLIALPLIYGWTIVARWSADREFAGSALQRVSGEDDQPTRRIVASLLAQQRSNYLTQLKSFFVGQEHSPTVPNQDLERLPVQRLER